MPEDPRAAPGRVRDLDPVDGPPPRRSAARLLFSAVRAGLIGGVVFGVLAWAAGDAGPVEDGIRFGVGFAIFILLVLVLRGPAEDASEERPRL